MAKPHKNAVNALNIVDDTEWPLTVQSRAGKNKDTILDLGHVALLPFAPSYSLQDLVHFRSISHASVRKGLTRSFAFYSN